MSWQDVFFKVRRDLVALEERLQCHRSFYRKLEECSSLKFEELSTPTSSDCCPQWVSFGIQEGPCPWVPLTKNSNGTSNVLPSVWFASISWMHGASQFNLFFSATECLQSGWIMMDQIDQLQQFFRKEVPVSCLVLTYIQELRQLVLSTQVFLEVI